MSTAAQLLTPEVVGPEVVGNNANCGAGLGHTATQDRSVRRATCGLRGLICAATQGAAPSKMGSCPPRMRSTPGHPSVDGRPTCQPVDNNCPVHTAEQFKDRVSSWEAA